MALHFEGRILTTDKEGYLKNLDDWSDQVAIAIAEQENLKLNDMHWEIIHLVRKFYQTYDVSPAMRPLVKYINQNLGKEKASSIYLLTLFPGSPAKLISKIAGLPRPTNCL